MMKWRKAGEKDERVEQKIIKFLVQLRHHLSLVRGTSLLIAEQSAMDVLCLVSFLTAQYSYGSGSDGDN